VAFFSSLLILIGSFVSYKKSIKSRIDSFESNNFANRDEIDLIEDRYDLYSEDEISDEEVIKEEKKRLSFIQSLKNLKYSSSFVSIYRLLGYLFLLFGFFFLVNNSLFDVFSYLFGFLIVPFISIFSGVFIDIKKSF
jgi:Fe2+ transport system protein B